MSEPKSQGLETTLASSAELLNEIRHAWGDLAVGPDPRCRAVTALCQMSIDHASAVQAMISTLPQSAISLVRPQYEALVRATWAFHVSSDRDLERLLNPLSQASQQEAKKLPGVQDMLKKLEESGPRGASQLLGRARENLYGGLNSYLHAGIHPLSRHLTGYPEPLLVAVLQNSNALAMLSIIVMAELLPDHAVIPWMHALHQNFANVLPPLEPLAVASS